MSSLARKFDEQTKKRRILDLVADGVTLNQIAQQLNVTRRYIDETLKEELASSETPEKILAMRDLQSAQIQSHTPRLAQRFIKQSDLQNKLTDQYIALVDQQNMTYTTLYDNYIMEGFEPEEAHQKTVADLAEYHTTREQLSKEVERVSKLADTSYRTYLEQQKRLSQLHGTDTPSQHHIMISRTDQIRLELEAEIKQKQKQIEARNKQIEEAQIIEENK